MEIFEVTPQDHLKEVADKIKTTAREHLTRGIKDFKMTVEVPFGTTIDEVIDEIENNTNLLVGRERYRGCGFQHNTNIGKVWFINVWL